MSRAEILRRTLANPEIEAKRRAAAAKANGLKLLKYCPKRGFAVPPDKLEAYRMLRYQKRMPPREAARLLGLTQ